MASYTAQCDGVDHIINTAVTTTDLRDIEVLRDTEVISTSAVQGHERPIVFYGCVVAIGKERALHIPMLK
jgi:hypothetical protein